MKKNSWTYVNLKTFNLKQIKPFFKKKVPEKKITANFDT